MNCCKKIFDRSTREFELGDKNRPRVSSFPFPTLVGRVGVINPSLQYKLFWAPNGTRLMLNAISQALIKDLHDSKTKHYIRGRINHSWINS